ncbi:UNVERIFIED_CONTAM: hypothetical protein GTU68_028417 [Idotea baltica]|nr:hypothetical protein [Idotea baltica]
MVTTTTSTPRWNCPRKPMPRSSSIPRERPAVRSVATRSSSNRSRSGCSACRPRPRFTPATATQPRSVPRRRAWTSGAKSSKPKPKAERYRFVRPSCRSA